jgi:hypothetical protein
MFDFGFSQEDDRFTRRLVISMKALALIGVGFLFASYLTAFNLVKKVAPTIPTHILIKGEVWDVDVVEQSKFPIPNAIGLTDCEHNIIFLSKSVHGAALRSSLLHELFHGAVCSWDKTIGWYPDNSFYEQGSKDAIAHPAIYAAEISLAPILQDNPRLAVWLASKDSDEQVRMLLEIPAGQ